MFGVWIRWLLWGAKDNEKYIREWIRVICNETDENNYRLVFF
jgi:hypothetical protein